MATSATTGQSVPGELVSGSATAGAAGQKPSSAKSRKTAAVQSQKPARLR